MALRAGYYGIKKKILNKLLPDYSDPGVLTNKDITSLLKVKTVTHEQAITEGDLTVTFTEFITGNIEQITGTIVSSVDKDINAQTGISIGTSMAHKPKSTSEVIGCISSSLSASDRRPICSIRISNTGRISVDGQMTANRNYSFTITFVFEDTASRSLNKTASPEDVPEEVIEEIKEEKPVTKKTTRKTTVKEGE